MNLRSKAVWVMVFLCLLTNITQAQDSLLDALADSSADKSQPVFATFKTTRVVNGHSVETVKRRGLDFRVTHHFGDISGDGGNVHTLYGLDQAADIRIAFEYGVTDKLTLGIGRSKISELVDGYAKYSLFTQTQDNHMPVSTTLLINAGFTPQRAVESEYANVAHRLSYTYQVLVARKFSPLFSLQLMPTLLHRNYLFDPQDEHDLFSMGIGGRLKLTKRFALLADYFYTFSGIRNEANSGYYAPLGFGVEIETGGHVFHMFFTNNAGIVENNFIPNTTSSWGEGEFKFGFNISRTFGTGQ
ncbi:DUF5777 family beta-barrel protein [Pontibacter sp. CAU 1760]